MVAQEVEKELEAKADTPIDDINRALELAAYAETPEEVERIFSRCTLKALKLKPNDTSKKKAELVKIHTKNYLRLLNIADKLHEQGKSIEDLGEKIADAAVKAQAEKEQPVKTEEPVTEEVKPVKTVKPKKPKEPEITPPPAAKEVQTKADNGGKINAKIKPKSPGGITPAPHVRDAGLSFAQADEFLNQANSRQEIAQVLRMCSDETLERIARITKLDTAQLNRNGIIMALTQDILLAGSWADKHLLGKDMKRKEGVTEDEFREFYSNARRRAIRFRTGSKGNKRLKGSNRQTLNPRCGERKEKSKKELRAERRSRAVRDGEGGGGSLEDFAFNALFVHKARETP